MMQPSNSKLPLEADQLEDLDLQTLRKLAQFKVGQWVPLGEIRSEIREEGNSVYRINRSIAKLNKEKWISTTQNPQDKRQKQLRLTVKARKILEPALKPAMYPLFASNVAVKYPETSKLNYLTAMAALNAPSKDGTGDWHFIETFEGGSKRKPGPFSIAGVNYTKTNHIFGSEGIREISDDVRKAGVAWPGKLWAANHYRAMADMVFHQLDSDKSLHSYNVDDWFPQEDHKQELIAFLLKLSEHLKPESSDRLSSWMEENKLGYAETALN